MQWSVNMSSRLTAHVVGRVHDVNLCAIICECQAAVALQQALQRLSAQGCMLPLLIVAPERQRSLTGCLPSSTFAVVLIVLALNDTSGCECPVNV